MIQQKLLAEFFGTAGLLTAVIGSGIMAERLSGGNDGVTLLANTLATVFALYILIESFGKTSGAHFNPVVSLIMLIQKQITLPLCLGYIIVQFGGAACGAWLSHLMFDMEIVQFATKSRTGIGQWVAEIAATAGLIFVILRSEPAKTASLVACYIGGAYWFTSSTSFANPAAAFGRLFSDSFAGIMPAHVPLFIIAQIIGGLLGLCLYRALRSK